MNFRGILIKGTVTRDVPLGFYIILPISIILGISIFCIISRLKTDQMLGELGFGTKKQYDAYKRSCPLNYENKFALSDEWAINEYSHKVYRTDDISTVSSTIRQLEQGNYRYGIVIDLRNGDTDSFFLNSCKERDQLMKEINAFLERRTDHTE